jgi:undecaprenyl-diphosphatase
VPIIHAIVLGIVQGLTEFLPVSSSGHLRLAPWLFGWNDFAGRSDLEQSFDVALHLGTLIGVVAYLRNDIVELVRGGLSVLRPSARAPRPSAVGTHGGSAVEVGVDPAPGPIAPTGDSGRLAWLLLASAIPAAVMGALFNDAFAEVGEHEWLIGLMLIVFGLVLAAADRMGGDRAADDFRPLDALRVGTAQALALVPGVSRSGATMTAARFFGFQRDAAARLSFLMSLPVIAGALLFEGSKLVADGIPNGMYWPLVVGIAASGITGWFAVWATLAIVRTRTFMPFVVYRIALGVLVLVVAATGLR